MARHKFSKEEVEQWRKEHNQSVFYINKNDSNLTSVGAYKWLQECQ